jgi:exonuclease SbcD
LSTGDWHWNCGYDDDIASSIEQIVTYIKDHPVDLVAITGDVYDRASEPGSRNRAAEYIRDLARESGVLIVRGNHDAPGDLEILSKLEVGYRVTVDESPNVHHYDHVAIQTIPWLTKAKWQSLHPEASKEEGDKTVSQMVIEFIKNSVLLNQDKKLIVIGHMTIAGAQAQNHQQMGADGVTLGAYDMDDAGVWAAILGHIHLRQTFSGERFFYNGSIAALDYGEFPEKFFSVLDTNTGNVEWIKLNTVNRIDINAHWSPAGIGMDLEKVDLDSLEGSRVRVNLRVEGGDNVEAAKKQIEEFLAGENVLEFKINPQVLPLEAVRAVEISKSTSMKDKLTTYWEATEPPPEATQMGMQDKLSELEDAGLCSL